MKKENQSTCLKGSHNSVPGLNRVSSTFLPLVGRGCKLTFLTSLWEKKKKETDLKTDEIKCSFSHQKMSVVKCCCSAIFMIMRFMQFLSTVIAFHFHVILYPTQPYQWQRLYQFMYK